MQKFFLILLVELFLVSLRRNTKQTEGFEKLQLTLLSYYQ